MKSYYVIEKQTIEKTHSLIVFNAFEKVSQHKTFKSALKSLKELSTNILTFDEMKSQLKETNVVYTIAKVVDDEDVDLVEYNPFDYYVILEEEK